MNQGQAEGPPQDDVGLIQPYPRALVEQEKSRLVHVAKSFLLSLLLCGGLGELLAAQLFGVWAGGLALIAGIYGAMAAIPLTPLTAWAFYPRGFEFWPLLTLTCIGAGCGLTTVSVIGIAVMLEMFVIAAAGLIWIGLRQRRT